MFTFLPSFSDPLFVGQHLCASNRAAMDGDSAQSPGFPVCSLSSRRTYIVLSFVAARGDGFVVLWRLEPQELGQRGRPEPYPTVASSDSRLSFGSSHLDRLSRRFMSAIRLLADFFSVAPSISSCLQRHAVLPSCPLPPALGLDLSPVSASLLPKDRSRFLSSTSL